MKLWTCEWPTKRDGIVTTHGMTPAIALAAAANRVGDRSAGKPRLGLLRPKGITPQPQKTAVDSGKTTTEEIGR